MKIPYFRGNVLLGLVQSATVSIQVYFLAGSAIHESKYFKYNVVV